MLKEWEATGSSPKRPATTSVEPPPISTTSRFSPGKSLEAPKNVSCASREPGITANVTPRSAKRAANSGPLAASREAEVAMAMSRRTGCSGVS